MIALLRSSTFAGVPAAIVAATLLLGGCGGGATPAQTPASGTPPGPSVEVAADGLTFDATQLGVAANVAFTIVFDNREAVPHNISIDRQQGDTQTRVFSGPATRWYAVPALAPGEYTFLCQVHPSMTGRLLVGNE
jgi:plastocyanin